MQAIVDQVLNNEGSLMGLTTLRDYDEYTFTHSVNVCIFSVALGRKLGFTIFDAQVMNPHLERMGAYEVPIAEFIDELAKVAHAHTPWSSPSKRPNAD